MKRLSIAIGAGALILAASACAHQPAIGYGGQPPAPPQVEQPAPSATVVPKPENERMVVPDSEVDASKLPKGYPRQVWTQDDGSVVVAKGEEGGCSHVHGQITDQNDRTVTFTFVEQIPDPVGVCTMDIRYPPVAAKLAKPLGGRTVVLDHQLIKVPRH